MSFLRGRDVSAHVDMLLRKARALPAGGDVDTDSGAGAGHSVVVVVSSMSFEPGADGVVGDVGDVGVIVIAGGAGGMVTPSRDRSEADRTLSHAMTSS